MMQSSELPVEALDSGADTGWLESFGLAEKLPVALVFGCILGLSAPTFGFSWLAWVGLAPLLVLIRGANTQIEAVFIGLVYGLGYHLVGLSWYLGLHPMTWMGLGDLIGDQIVALTWIIESLHESLFARKSRSISRDTSSVFSVCSLFAIHLGVFPMGGWHFGIFPGDPGAPTRLLSIY
jgi:apolipoprotein N-acyltransferase